MSTIFISIAAYNDPQLKATIASAIKNADNPDNIFFGVALQYYNEPDLSEFSNIKTLSYHPDTRPGIVRVRYDISTKLFDQQDFYLQIDSHYSFADGWDSLLVEAYNEISNVCNSEKIMILPLEVYEDEIMSSRFTANLEDLGFSTKILHPKPDNTRIKYDGLKYHEIPYARVGQIFFPGEYISSVGLDQYSQTSLEIAYFSYRTIMSGYRVFQLNQKVLWEDSLEYYKSVWNGDSPGDSLKQTNRFGSSKAVENDYTWYEFSLAFIYNSFSKYSIPNAKIEPQEFWAKQGQLEEYNKAKEYFDSIIYNDYQ